MDSLSAIQKRIKKQIKSCKSGKDCEIVAKFLSTHAQDGYCSCERITAAELNHLNLDHGYKKCYSCGFFFEP